MMKKAFDFLWSKKWIILILVLISGGYLWWKSNQASNEKVVTVIPEVRDIVEVLTVSGKVDAEEKARLSFAGASKLTWLPIKEGDVVKKWQGLAQVDARTLKNQMDIAQNTHGKVFRTFENTLDSVDYYSASGLTEIERRSAESAQLDIRNSALTVESADIAVKLAFMSSPINGVVTRIDQKNVGAYMLPTDMIEVVNPSSIFFSAVIDEEDVTKVNVLQGAKVELDAFPNQQFESQVKLIAFTPSISESGGTGYSVRLSLPVDNSNMNYRIGMNGEANIVLDQKNQVLSIPVDSLIEREGKQFVDVSKADKTERVEITTGISDENFIEVTSGLTANDLVIMPSSN